MYVPETKSLACGCVVGGTGILGKCERHLMTALGDFKVGDVVVLKSGSPEMTVAGESYGSVRCQWFSDSVLKDGTFKAEALEKAESD